MRISDWSSDVCSSDLAELATIIAKMAAKMSSMPPALSLSRKSRNAERGGKLRVMGKLFPYFVSRFDNNRRNGVGFTNCPYSLALKERMTFGHTGARGTHIGDVERMTGLRTDRQSE